MRRLPKMRVVARALSLLMLAPVSTYALELGEASVKSALGESLLVQIPYRLASNEELTPACIRLAPALDGGALPTYTRSSRVSVSPTHIEIFDYGRVLEPLIGINVEVRCATAPRFIRSYALFVDPPLRLPAVSANTSAATSEPSATPASVSANRAATAESVDVSPRARGEEGGALRQGEIYRVVRGDTLSGIAARVADRPVTIRAMADAIFAANPDAFVRDNPDLLVAGRSLTIPVMTTPSAEPTSAPVSAVSAVAPPVAPPEPQAAQAPAQVAPLASDAPRVAATLPAAEPVAIAALEPLPGAVAEPPPAAIAPLPTPAAVDATPAATAPETSVSVDDGFVPAPLRTAAWLAALALGAALLIGALLAIARRRKQPAAAAEPRRRATRKTAERRLVDPRAGIEVVETQPDAPLDDDPTTPSEVLTPAAAAPAAFQEPRVDVDAHAEAAAGDVFELAAGQTESVDLDVGAPVVLEERVDWFAGNATAAANDAAPSQVDDAAETALLPAERAVSAAPPPHLRPVDDSQMTLTIVELDMLRQDYEAEHTLTQQSSAALREAVADLEATKAARAAAELTETLVFPAEVEESDDAAETETALIESPTARVRGR